MATDQTEKSASKNFASRVLLFKPDTAAIAQIAQATAVVIATLLTLPDALAIIPGSTSASSWVLSLVGIWIIAAVLWFVGFTAILYAVGIAVQGVEITCDGIRLWRLAKPLQWEQIEAISVEPQVFFSTFFRLSATARRLTVFERKKGLDGKSRLAPHYVPSFFFLPAQFEALCACAFEGRFGFRPDCVDAFIAAPGCLPRLQTTFGHLRWQRIALSLVITLGLGLWLYKKGVSNYAFNSGNKAMDSGDYLQAERLYKWALQVDPIFAAAWNHLGNAQYRYRNTPEATGSWERAIALKPDFVEPRISLSYIALEHGEFIKARELIDKALNLDPLNPYAMLNRAELEMKQGQMRAAMEDARMVTVQEPDHTSALFTKASCLLAQGKVRLGEPQAAAKILLALPPQSSVDRQQAELRLLVAAETALALNQSDDAEKFCQAVLAADSRNLQALCGLASVSLTKKRFEQAARRIDQAASLSPEDPSVNLLRAKLFIERGERVQASRAVTRALTMSSIDGLSLVEAGKICLTLHQLDQAALCAQRALRMNSEDKAAKKLLACVTAQRTGYDASTW